MRTSRLLLGGPALVAVAAVLVLLLARQHPRLPDPNKAPDTSHASWRGYDSGYQHPSSRKSEDTNAQQR